ncbi:MAG: hypothetical protein K2W95_32105 [Candidatus Obscuribacterales bacterium]|nr:hypothetical protein [Candidatus Obscuribacterales bacterium]
MCGNEAEEVEQRAGPLVVPDAVLELVREVKACDPGAQVEYVQRESVVKIRPGRRQVNIFYGGLSCAMAYFSTVLTYRGPLDSSFTLPVVPEPLDAFARYLDSNGFSVVRAIRDGVADWHSTSMYTGNFLVYNKGDLVVTVGWNR